MTDRIAVIRIRGVRNVKPNIRKTFELLRLERPNHCVVVDPSPQTLGMLNVVKDYVTFGKISDKTLSSLDAKRGKKAAKGAEAGSRKPETRTGGKAEQGTQTRKPVYRLHPPKKGMKDIKLPWPMGVLGAREDMDVFIKKMI